MTPRKGYLSCALCLGVTLSAFQAAAQMAQQELPEGHPPISENGAPVAPPLEEPMPTGAPPQDGPQQMPPNHPPVPTKGWSVQVPTDRIEPADSVPPLTIDATFVGPDERPRPNLKVELRQHRESTANGEANALLAGTSDAEGRFVFRGAELITSDTDYQLVFTVDGTATRTPPFRLERQRGTSARVHVFPLVRPIEEALVAFRGFVFVEPRDEDLSFEYAAELINLGASTWHADGTQLTLPAGFKAFATVLTDPNLGVERTDTGVRLKGVVPPGRHSLSFTFQLPTDNSVSLDVTLPLWPRTVEAQVATLSGAGLELAVADFPAARPMQVGAQKSMLVTGQSYAEGGGEPPTQLRFTLSGLPVTGHGRWVALGVSGLLVLLGFAGRWKARTQSAGGNDELKAKERLIDELADLSRAHQQGLIGPQSYEEAKEALLSALVRLESMAVSSRA